MKVAICDDEFYIYDQLRSFIYHSGAKQQIQDDLEIFYFSSGERLLQSYKKRASYDIIFLDIAMRRMDGIAVGKVIRSYDEKAVIIFVSSHQERVMEAFDCMAFHFLTKPLSLPKFDEIFMKALRFYQRDRAQYVIQFRNEIVRFPIDQIKYVEVVHRHLMFHTTDGDFETVATLRDTVEELRPYDFVQVHQGFVVNMNQVKRLLRSELIMIDGSTVPLSAHRRSEVVMAYKTFLERY